MSMRWGVSLFAIHCLHINQPQFRHHIPSNFLVIVADPYPFESASFYRIRNRNFPRETASGSDLLPWNIWRYATPMRYNTSKCEVKQGGTGTVNIRTVTVTSTRYSFTYEVRLHLRGTATSTRYGYIYEVQLLYTYEVRLHLRGTATTTRYGYIYKVRQHLQGTATSTRYGYIYEVRLHLRDTTTPTRYS